MVIRKKIDFRMKVHLALLIIEIFTIPLLPLLCHSTKKWEMRCHRLAEIATDLRGIGKSVIGHVFTYKSLRIPCNNQK